MSQSTVSLRREGAIAFVTLSNAGRLNAMTRAMWRELRAVFDGIAHANDAGLRCVVVSGEGAAFCAGGDISEYPSFRFDEASLREFHENEVWAALQAMLDCPVPLVAQIEGACMGAGIEIASCCDIRLAGASAKFGAPIAKLGFPMAPREAALVHGAIGDVLARDMLLAAGVHGAQRLYDAGFLLHVLPDSEVAAAAQAHAARIGALAPQAARLHKRTFAMLKAGAQSTENLLATAYDYADSAEHREGIAAFLAKRTPNF
ncbi:enoyl-CoA hydratase/isomerase family protein [Variovorax paradoxus]|uniref:enoyl-CoA hydratase/isomerase family protein n=1 Tax=Variovorax paradoxus TaxID=34073 RepID=UPI00248154BD|nr:enoyl-CoA hydratase/isomerase family protein [Variovorax paradoxus]WGT66121.1 enoyl-CoA hydratase/isomerase family protein [Variovorax paradoxus]